MGFSVTYEHKLFFSPYSLKIISKMYMLQAIWNLRPFANGLGRLQTDWFARPFANGLEIQAVFCVFFFTPEKNKNSKSRHSQLRNGNKLKEAYIKKHAVIGIGVELVKWSITASIKRQRSHHWKQWMTKTTFFFLYGSNSSYHHMHSGSKQGC